MGREVRKVPSDWEHPRDTKGDFIPLFDSRYTKEWEQWHEERDHYLRGEVRSYRDGWKKKPDDAPARYTEWAGEPPNPDDYMPAWVASVATHYMMYETCTEGTPISPAFATAEELARWLTDSEASAFGSMTADYDEWLGMINDGWAPSAVIREVAGGRTELRSGVAAAADAEGEG